MNRSQYFAHSTQKERDKPSIHFKTEFRVSKPDNSFNDHRR